MSILQKIISGGQTGADRAALDAAMAAGFPAGGYCPSGRRAEDGPIDAVYPLIELAGGYRQRTRRNLQEADGTVIFYRGMPTGGTALTLALCLREQKPFRLIDMELVSVEQACTAVLAFIRAQRIAVLNVAGPRESGQPGIYDYSFRVLTAMIRASMSSNTGQMPC
ncbi:putative molybdenum carrier protein [Zobellella iuensis]|uniref:Molybdenum carrier protein n=1 Tax=Zobellella iuensis TaxID=2803811 RepID=A0ABS1QS42_9GAMM|nr:putative molybdenum carrier protein [Zobellella iuensis]MBL1377281.1 putative molybdenum carrier protein [Zobellella iuensis]